MPIRQIGSLDVSLVGLGCNNFGGRTNDDQSTEVVRASLDAGINFFDTADVYGGTRSEEILGAALGQDRADVVVATKFGMTLSPERSGAAPKYVKSALEDSLRRLGTDYVDLYQLHRPDPETPIGDTLAALADLVKAGKVREIGCSNFSAAQLREAAAAAEEGAPRFVSVQNQYSLLQREPSWKSLPSANVWGPPSSPIPRLPTASCRASTAGASRLLPGTRLAGMPADRREALLADATMDVVEELERFAEQQGHSLLQLAIAWLAAKAVVASVIAGATKPEQVVANVSAADWVLTDEDLEAVDRIAPPPSLAR